MLLKSICLPTNNQHFYRLSVLYRSLNSNTLETDVKSYDHSRQTPAASVLPYESIPTIPTLPFFQSMWVFIPIIGKYKPVDAHKMHEDLYRKYGKIVRLKLQLKQEDKSAVFLYDPLDIETMFRQEGKYPIRMGFDSLKLYRTINDDVYSNGGLLVINGKTWSEFRTKVQNYMMKPKLIHNYLPQVNEVTNELVVRISAIKDKNDEVNQFLNELYKWAFESIGVIALDTKLGLIFNYNSNREELQQLIEHTSVILNNSWMLDFAVFPIWRWINKPFGKKWKQFINANKQFEKTAMKYITESINKIMSKSEDTREEPSILQQLLSRPDFDIKDAITMTLDLIMAGIDTTSHTVAFVLYHLATNQEAQQKLYEEITDIVGDSDEVTHTMLNDMKYLKACVKESLRITPTVNGTSRLMQNDSVIGGYRIPANTLLVGVNYIPCRDEQYFADALQYRPERWLRSNKTDAHPFLLLPFGFGPRMCIGKRIAEQEIWLLLIKLIQKFRIEYHYGSIGIKVKLVNTPDKPLRFNFIDRN